MVQSIHLTHISLSFTLFCIQSIQAVFILHIYFTNNLHTKQSGATNFPRIVVTQSVEGTAGVLRQHLINEAKPKLMLSGVN